MEPAIVIVVIFVVVPMFGLCWYFISKNCKSTSVSTSGYNHYQRTGRPNIRMASGNLSSGWRTRHYYDDSATNYIRNDTGGVDFADLHNVQVDNFVDETGQIHCQSHKDEGCFGGDDYLSNDADGDTGGGCDSGGGDTGGGCDSGGGDTGGGCDSGGGDTGGGCDSGGGDTGGGGDSGGGGCDD